MVVFIQSQTKEMYLSVSEYLHEAQLSLGIVTPLGEML